MQTYQEEVNAAIRGLGMGRMDELELCLLYLAHKREGTTRRAQIVADAAKQMLRLRGDCMGNA